MALASAGESRNAVRVSRPSKSNVPAAALRWSIERAEIPHRYPLGAQQPRRVPVGGAQRTITADEFPIMTTLSCSVLEIEPGAMRQLHWHPHADEWQYYLEGAAEMAVYLGRGHAVTEQFVAGDIGYVPMGAGHYIILFRN